MTPEIRVQDDEHSLAEDVADLFLWLAEQAMQSETGLFRVALSGGSTPRLLYARLADSSLGTLQWERVRFYFGDERCVPPNHPDSNFRLAEEALFRPRSIRPEHVFRMAGEAESAEQAALAYERLLREQFQAPAPRWPSFDLMLLGLGADGHTASLFPHTPSLREQHRAVVASEAPSGIRQRLTVTVPVINHAQTILFMVSGAAKAGAVRSVLEDRAADPTHYPAKLIRPVRGRLLWFLDRHAASQLRQLQQQVPSEEV